MLAFARLHSGLEPILYTNEILYQNPYSLLICIPGIN